MPLISTNTYIWLSHALIDHTAEVQNGELVSYFCKSLISDKWSDTEAFNDGFNTDVTKKNTTLIITIIVRFKKKSTIIVETVKYLLQKIDTIC
jgi:type IV secretory pathway VirB9-like protein